MMTWRTLFIIPCLRNTGVRYRHVTPRDRGLHLSTCQLNVSTFGGMFDILRWFSHKDGSG
jgi:hypothetical protein